MTISPFPSDGKKNVTHQGPVPSVQEGGTDWWWNNTGSDDLNLFANKPRHIRLSIITIFV